MFYSEKTNSSIFQDQMKKTKTINKKLDFASILNQAERTPHKTKYKMWIRPGSTAASIRRHVANRTILS